MKQLLTFLILIIIFANHGFGQNVAINTDGSNANSDAILHLKSTSKGLLIPTMTTAQRTSIPNVSDGLMVYDTQTNSFWFRDSGTWSEIASGEIDNSFIEDDDGNTKIQVEEGSNDNTIRFDINGSEHLSLYESSSIGRLKLNGQLDINDLAGGGTQTRLHFKSGGAERFSMGYNDDVGYFVIKDEVNNDQVLYIKDGKVGVQRSSPSNAFEVNGQASKSASGDWLANSDARLKKNITALSSESVLQKMLQLQGITYEWDDDKTGNNRPEGIQYGFTAQNIQEVYPELVSEDNLGYLQTAYGTYDAMYVEAIRELVNKIETLETRINKLESASDLSTAK